MKTRLYNLLLLLVLLAPVANAQKRNVLVLDVKDEIDVPMQRYVELGLDHGTQINADLVLIEMDTYGGAVDAAKSIVEAIMRYPKPVWVFINSDAASAGALISIACDSIYMSPGASMGAATVVDGTGNKLSEKHQSFMRSTMRSTAQANNRNPAIAEAMVDEDVMLDSTIKAPGKILSFTTAEAIANGYCEGQVNSVEEILTKNNITDYTITRFELSTLDSVIGFFLNPFISGLLLMMIIGGIYYEIQAPGLGLPGLLAVIALVLYLIPYYATGLAEYWEIIAFIIGLALIAVEIFILPGFGVAGISGIIVVVGSLVLIMLNNDNFDFELVEVKDIWVATVVALSGVLGGVVLLFVGGSNLHRTKMYKHIAHMDTMDRAKGYTSSFLKEPMTGKKGVSQTVLRPGGKVLIDGVVYDAYTMGEYIEPGMAIEVIGDETTSLRVRMIHNS